MKFVVILLALLFIPLFFGGCYTQLGIQEDEGVLSSSQSGDQPAGTTQVDPYDDYFYSGSSRSSVGFFYYYPSAFPSDIFAFESATYLTPTMPGSYGMGGYGYDYGTGYGYGYGPGHGQGYWNRSMAGYYSPLDNLPPSYYFYHHTQGSSGGVGVSPQGASTPDVLYNAPSRDIGTSRIDLPTGGVMVAPSTGRTGTSGTTSTGTGNAPVTTGARPAGSERGQNTTSPTQGHPASPAPADRGGNTRTTVKPAAAGAQTPAPTPTPVQPTPTQPSTPVQGVAPQPSNGTQSSPPPAPPQQDASKSGGTRQAGSSRDNTPPKP